MEPSEIAASSIQGAPAAHGLKGYGERPLHWLVGIMSGTSLDGIDAVLVEIQEVPRSSVQASPGLPEASEGHIGAVRLLGQVYLPYPDDLRGMLLDLCTLDRARIDSLVVVHSGLGQWYAAAVESLLERCEFPAHRVDAICLHGQTVWHAPVAVPFPAPPGKARPDSGTMGVTGTLQIGSAAVLNEMTGIPVISDFRSADMAAGGEGAPLAPYVDALLYGDPHLGRVVQNIGGIGNATILPPGARTGEILAFDTGPGNMIMDAVVAEATGGRERYDAGGSMAARGRVDESLVQRLIAADPYYARKPPKSTGREVYGRDYVARFLALCAEAGLGPEDCVATATALTAESIALAMREFVLPKMRLDEIVIGGGGAKNPSLLSMLGTRLPGVRIRNSAELGIPEDAREAVAFAVMGHETLMGRPGNLPAVTGASHAVVLGSLTGFTRDRH